MQAVNYTSARNNLKSIIDDYSIADKKLKKEVLEAKKQIEKANLLA